MTDAWDRATAALYGLAIGDALGMPTQLLSRAEIREQFSAIEGFEAAGADHPIAAGMRAGTVTDDTRQALLVADALLAGAGHVDAAGFAQALVAWEDEMRAGGSLDLLGPSTRAAVRAVLAGVPIAEAGRNGATNGAAMRVTPVGIAVSSRDLAALVDRVEEAGLVSHHTGIATAGAAAVAAAVSAGIDGASIEESIEVAIGAAALGARRGRWVAGADIGRRIRFAVDLVRDADGDRDRAREDLATLIGTSLATQESVPCAFGVLALHPRDPWRACCAAASLGGDTDTIAAMAGAVAGATAGMSAWPADAVRVVGEVNGLDFAPLAEGLLALR